MTNVHDLKPVRETSNLTNWMSFSIWRILNLTRNKFNSNVFGDSLQCLQSAQYNRSQSKSARPRCRAAIRWSSSDDNRFHLSDFVFVIHALLNMTEPGNNASCSNYWQLSLICEPFASTLIKLFHRRAQKSSSDVVYHSIFRYELLFSF